MKAVARELLGVVCENVKKEFEEQKFILSYEEFLEVFAQNPKKLVRNSAQYIYDMFNYFGFERWKK